MGTDLRHGGRRSGGRCRRHEEHSPGATGLIGAGNKAHPPVTAKRGRSDGAAGGRHCPGPPPPLSFGNDFRHAECRTRFGREARLRPGAVARSRARSPGAAGGGARRPQPDRTRPRRRPRAVDGASPAAQPGDSPFSPARIRRRALDRRRDGVSPSGARSPPGATGCRPPAPPCAIWSSARARPPTSRSRTDPRRSTSRRWNATSRMRALRPPRQPGAAALLGRRQGGWWPRGRRRSGGAGRQAGRGGGGFFARITAKTLDRSSGRSPPTWRGPAAAASRSTTRKHAVGLRCVAAPVFDAEGRAVAALSLSGPAARISDARLETAWAGWSRRRRPAVTNGDRRRSPDRVRRRPPQDATRAGRRAGPARGCSGRGPSSGGAAWRRRRRPDHGRRSPGRSGGGAPARVRRPSTVRNNS